MIPQFAKGERLWLSCTFVFLIKSKLTDRRCSVVKCSCVSDQAFSDEFAVLAHWSRRSVTEVNRRVNVCMLQKHPWRRSRKHKKRLGDVKTAKGWFCSKGKRRRPLNRMKLFCATSCPYSINPPFLTRPKHKIRASHSAPVAARSNSRPYDLALLRKERTAPSWLSHSCSRQNSAQPPERPLAVPHCSRACGTFNRWRISAHSTCCLFHASFWLKRSA